MVMLVDYESQTWGSIPPKSVDFFWAQIWIQSDSYCNDYNYSSVKGLEYQQIALFLVNWYSLIFHAVESCWPYYTWLKHWKISYNFALSTVTRKDWEMGQSSWGVAPT